MPPSAGLCTLAAMADCGKARAAGIATGTVMII
jgi:hypothetical protein